MDVNTILATLAYTGIGMVVFVLAFFAMVMLSPFSAKKEIEEDQNVALAILYGSVILGLAHIIAATVAG